MFFECNTLRVKLHILAFFGSRCLDDLSESLDGLWHRRDEQGWDNRVWVRHIRVHHAMQLKAVLFE